jgi:hypothetical protein
MKSFRRVTVVGNSKPISGTGHQAMITCGELRSLPGPGFVIERAARDLVYTSISVTGGISMGVKRIWCQWDRIWRTAYGGLRGDRSSRNNTRMGLTTGRRYVSGRLSNGWRIGSRGSGSGCIGLGGIPAGWRQRTSIRLVCGMSCLLCSKCLCYTGVRRHPRGP